MTENDSSGGSCTRFYGTYRGSVVNTVDPLKKGRLLVKVPDVLGEIPQIWAEPVSPFGGTGCGLYVVPAPNAGVMVQFENGDPMYPIWTGFYRDTPAELPPLSNSQPPAVPQFTISTPTQNTLIISDMGGASGGIRLQHRSGSFISISEEGVMIAAPMIKILGVLDVNGGALHVT